jgi:hypothetical protein
MKDTDSQPKVSPPKVAPPASYKAPSLPTLAALGAISTAALLSGGCVRGAMPCPTHCASTTPPITDEITPMEFLDGDIAIDNEQISGTPE